jgi:choline-sulfatase
MKEAKETDPIGAGNAADISRRRFLQGTAATAGALALPQGMSAAAAKPPKLKQPNFLILMCDEMRYPPVYESAETKVFRQTFLRTQNILRRNGVDFERHYAASVACSPSRASLYTGQYPSLHGVTQTAGAAKRAYDSDMFWLDPNSVPTLGDYFRAAGYRTYWRGKWHASDADMWVPGTHTQILSYDPSNGAPDSANQALYTSADRLDRFGFTGWIGPEPHGAAPLNSGSSVPPGQQGRDIGFAQQAASLIRQLDHDARNKPWLVVSSFVNPHDIALWGLWVNTGRVPGFDFTVEPYVPIRLFDPVQFAQTTNDNLSTKPSAQASYQASYAQWMQPILDDPVTLEQYYRYYYQLQKNVDDQMMTVLQALLGSRYRDDTIVIFTSDHGDLLGAHFGMHQKWYTAYDEALRVPLIIYNEKLFPSPRSVDSLTSHIDLLPTLLGLAGIDPAPVLAELAKDYSDALPLVGRDLSELVAGDVSPSSVNDPLYFMTDDDPSRGLNQDNWTGIAYNSVIQPNHIETVIARLDGKVWKYSHYFDNPQFWSTPGYPNDPSDPNYPDVEDVIFAQKAPTPPPPPFGSPDYGPAPIPFDVTVKSTPRTDQFEMYNVTDDPMELSNLYNDGIHGTVQNLLAQLLVQQRCAKRLVPVSGSVPGQPTC